MPTHNEFVLCTRLLLLIVSTSSIYLCVMILDCAIGTRERLLIFSRALGTRERVLIFSQNLRTLIFLIFHVICVISHLL
jgi:hypothetical protein